MSKSFDRLSKSKFGISKSHKLLMMRSLLKSFLINQKLTLTLPRARYFKAFANQLFHKLNSSSDQMNAKRYLYSFLNSRDLVEKMSKLGSTRKEETNFINIYKVGYRKGDGALMAMVSYRKYE